MDYMVSCWKDVAAESLEPGLSNPAAGHSAGGRVLSLCVGVRSVGSWNTALIVGLFPKQGPGEPPEGVRACLEPMAQAMLLIAVKLVHPGQQPWAVGMVFISREGQVVIPLQQGRLAGGGIGVGNMFACVFQ